MSSSILDENLGSLIIDGGFRDEEAVLSLALSIGVFHDKKGPGDRTLDGVELERLSSFDLSAFIISDHTFPEPGLEEMRGLLLGHLSGGISMMIKRIGKKRGREALKEIARMLPP